MPQYIYEPPRPDRKAAFAEIIAAAIQMREQNRAAQEMARQKEEEERIKNMAGSVKGYQDFSALDPAEQEMLKARGFRFRDNPKDRFEEQRYEQASQDLPTLPQGARQQGAFRMGYGADMSADTVKLTNAQDVYGNAGDWAPTVQNRQMVSDQLALSAKETTDQGNVDREFTGIRLPESKAKIASEKALTADRYASAGKTKKETSLLGTQPQAPNALTVAGKQFSPETIAAGEDVMRGGDITRVPWADRMKVFEYVAARGGKAISKGVQDKLRGQQAAEVAVNAIEKAVQDYTSTPKSDLVNLARKGVALRSALMQSVPLIARGIGHTGVLTQQDFDSIVQGILGTKGALTGLGLTYALPEDAAARINSLRSQFGEVQNALLSDLIPETPMPQQPGAGQEKTVSRQQLIALANAEGKPVDQIVKDAIAEGYRVVP